MRVDEYLKHDMIGLAALIKRREVTSLEVLEAALERMNAVEPQINSITLDLTEQARAVAAAPVNGPLAGVPYLIKDHGALVAGTATSVASNVFKDVIQSEDSALITALRRAGIVIFGKTAVPELAARAVTVSRLYGITRNPWDLERTSGGSSGGSSSAVAAGIVPGAHATDGGGSIRGPASCTGLFGFKPSRGRVSYAPLSEGGGGTNVQHAITRSVRDSALLLDIVSVPQPGDPYLLPATERSFLEEVGRAPKILRIGFSTEAKRGNGLTPECAAAVRDAARLCQSLGHHVEEIAMPGSPPVSSSTHVVPATIAALLDREALRRGHPIADDELEELSLLFYRAGQNVTGSEYVRAWTEIFAYAREVARFFERYDVLLNSPMGSPPLLITELTDMSDFNLFRQRTIAFSPNTQDANLTGQPAMTVPLAWSSTGLPIGIQFTGRVADEATLFRLAGQLEEAQPWAHKRPPLFS